VINFLLNSSNAFSYPLPYFNSHPFFHLVSPPSHLYPYSFHFSFPLLILSSSHPLRSCYGALISWKWSWLSGFSLSTSLSFFGTVTPIIARYFNSFLSKMAFRADNAIYCRGLAPAGSLLSCSHWKFQRWEAVQRWRTRVTSSSNAIVLLVASES